MFLKIFFYLYHDNHTENGQMTVYQSFRLNYILFVFLLPLLFVGPASLHTKSLLETTPPEPSSPDEYFALAKDNYLNDQFDLSVTLFKQAGKGYLASNDYEGACNSLIYLAETHRLKQNITEARMALNEAYKIASNNFEPNHRIFSDYYRTEGTIAFFENDLDQTMASAKKSVDIRTRLNIRRDTNLILPYNLLGNAYYARYEYDKAIENYKKALSFKKYSLTQDDAEMADIYANMANAYRFKGQLKDALGYMDKAMTILNRIYPGNDTRKLTYLIDNAILLEKTGDLELSMQMYDQASEIVNAMSEKDYDWITYVYKNKGNLYDKMGDIEKAFSCYNYLLSIYNTNPEKFATELADINHNIGIIQYKKANFIVALEHYKISEITRKKANLPELGNTYNGIAGCYTKLGKRQEAEKYYTLAIRQHSLNPAENTPNLTNDYLAYGILCGEKGDYSTAKSYIQKAIRLNTAYFGEKHPETAKSYSLLGDIYTSEGKEVLAIEAYQNAIKASCTDFYLDNPAENPEIFGNCYGPELLNAMKKKAAILAGLNTKGAINTDELQNSLNTYDLCLNLIHKMRNSFGSFESKVEFSNEEKETYGQAIAVAMKLYRLTKDQYYKEKAFNYAEKGKSSILIASLRDRKAMQYGGIPDSLIEVESSIQKNIETYQHLILTENQKKSQDPKLISFWNEQLFNLKEALQVHIHYLEKNYPNYYALKYDDKTITTQQLKSKLSPREALVEYCITSDRILIFLAKTHQFEVFDFAKPADFENQISILRSYLESKEFYEQRPEQFEQYLSASSYLYQNLLKPIEPMIRNHELIIVPDDRLASIPFEVFLTAPVKNAFEYNNLPYLIKQYPIGYAYSANLLFNTHTAQNTNNNLRLAAFAPCYQAQNGDLGSILNYRDQLKPLPFAAKEANMVTSFFKGELFENSSASKAKFKAVAGDYDILHLSMHTIIDNNNPLQSRLAFTSNPQKNDDGMLNTFELFNLKLNARMAVLSACNSGVGRIHNGEGMMSLARGFYYAGCPNVVMTLWPVEDQVSSVLVKEFYQNLSEGKDKLEALRQAKLKFLENADPLRAHPYFWASYVNIGDMTPIVDKSAAGFTNYYLLFSLAGLLILLFPLLRKWF